MKVGIIGAGVMGSTHLEAWLHAGIPVGAFLEADMSRAYSTFAENSICGFEDFDSFISSVDIVDICVPTNLHAGFVEKAARAKKPIICEKPLARTLKEGRRMIQICKEENVPLYPAHVLRFFPEYKRARDAVAGGETGFPAVIRLSREAFSPRKEGDNWFLDSARSGGMILDLMLHDFDYALWLAGPVRSVYAKSVTASNPENPEDHALVILEHEGGTLSHIQGSWAMPAPDFRTSFEIAGTKRLLSFDSTMMAPLQTHIKSNGDSAGEVGLPSSPITESPYEAELKCFYSAITQGTETPVNAEDAIKALAVALAAIESAATGKAVNMESFNVGGES